MRRLNSRTTVNVINFFWEKCFDEFIKALLVCFLKLVIFYVNMCMMSNLMKLIYSVCLKKF